MEWYWAWYVLGPDTNTGNTMMTPSLFCPPVWISKGGIKKNSRNIFFEFSPNLFRKAVYIDKGWAVTFSWYLPMSLSDFTPALVWWVDYTMKANGTAAGLLVEEKKKRRKPWISWVGMGWADAACIILYRYTNNSNEKLSCIKDESAPPYSHILFVNDRIKG